ncbi:MAG TPA: thiamine-phosphate kinase [Fimbriiglobus sp.]|jgi:thiamine-monophosphate kinase
MPGEFDYIRWVRSQIPADPRVIVGPGDDCAVLERPANRPLVTTDMLMDGVDFILAETGPRKVGRKAMAVNLSDIAAMAGVPTVAVASVALPRDGGREIGEELFLGMRDVAEAFDVSLVGGDTNSWAGGLVISVTVLGEATAKGPVLRSGAKAGDWIFVTGPLGGSLLGKHLDVKPRVKEALALHAAFDLHAMIDVSDGLAADLSHVLEESRCGGVLHADAIPIAPAAHERAQQTGKTPLQHALGDGEDFELIFTVSPADGAKLLWEPPIPGVVKIGECVERGLWLETAGIRTEFVPTGWVHSL